MISDIIRWRVTTNLLMRFGLGMLFLQLITVVAFACSFHIALPELSIGDRVIESSNVILARENPDKPFSFHPVDSLKGETSNPDIPLLVDSATRRLLKLNQGDAVLISRSSASGEWRRLAYVREQDRTAFENMVAASNAWQSEKGELDRFKFFAALHDHPQSSVRKITLTELDKTAYRHLRKMQVRLSAREIHDKLFDRYELPWIPIRILMLGILGSQESRSLIEKAIQNIEDSGFESNIGAWATAYIEVDGAEAIERLTQRILLNKTSPNKSVESVLTAIAVQGSQGDPSLKTAIDSSLEKTLDALPERAALIAGIFGAQQDYSQSAPLLKVMNSGALRTPHDLLIVVSYLSLAQKSKERTE